MRRSVVLVGVLASVLAFAPGVARADEVVDPLSVEAVGAVTDDNVVDDDGIASYGTDDAVATEGDADNGTEDDRAEEGGETGDGHANEEADAEDLVAGPSEASLPEMPEAPALADAPAPGTSPKALDRNQAAQPVLDGTGVSEQANANADAADAQVDASADDDAKAGADTNASADAAQQPTTSGVNMYRLYNPNSGEHFYTGSLYEAKSVAEAGWRWEGVGWVAPTTSAVPVFRLYNPNAGDHHYTLSAYERDHLVSVGWRYEGIGWYSDANQGVAVLRQYNPNAVTGTHNFTTNKYENDSLVKSGWRAEGIGWWSTNLEARQISGFWLVTAAWGNKESYWIASNGSVARNRVVSTEEGSDHAAYVNDEGVMIRAAYAAGNNRVYLADSQGRLASGEGWFVTAAYGNGLHRYYLEGNGYVTGGYSTRGGYGHFVDAGLGYVNTSGYVWHDNAWWKSDAEGRLSAAGSPQAAIIEAYLNWTTAIANDNSHGYSQINRWGPDYDCSSLVISALRAAGISAGAATYTGNMLGELTKVGWQVISDIGLRKRGDILLNTAHHTEFYLGNNQKIGAHSDERGGIGRFAQSGDQTGREICANAYANYPWTCLLRLR